MISSLVVTNQTTPEHLDSFFTQLRENSHVKLIIDASKCSNITPRRIMSIKGVLDKHREYSRENIEFSVIFVKSGFVRDIIRLGLNFIKTERPVFVELLPKY